MRQRESAGPVLRIVSVVALLMIVPGSPSFAAVAPEATVRWFQNEEQRLMDAVGKGDKQQWDRVMDDGCIVTSEEGEVLPKKQFLDDLRPLPPGLSGSIRVQDLTVQSASDIAIVRFLADEHEAVFGQQLATQYRTTDTFKRSGAEWKMLSSHTSVVTKNPAARQVSRSGWPALAGTYQLLPDGWKFHVVLRKEKLYGGRDPAKLRPLIPLTADAFVLQGSLGEWLFFQDETGKTVGIVDFRKFEPLIWTRVPDPPASATLSP